MAPTVARAKTAFQFFQADKLADIKKELGGSMGAAMTEVSGLVECACIAGGTFRPTPRSTTRFAY